MNVKANMCSCCQEVWNQTNLVEVSLGEHSLYLCPDCFKELQKMIDNKKSEHGDKTSHWIERPHESGENWEYSMYECSDCHEWSDNDSNYCPNCGAKMKGGK